MKNYLNKIVRLAVIVITLAVFLGCSEDSEEGKNKESNRKNPEDFVSEFSGQAAYDYTQQLVNFGKRVSGSEQIAQTAEFIKSELVKNGIQTVSYIDFVADTPKGKIPMRNIAAKINGREPNQFIIVSTHYDLKMMPEDVYFEGANDSGSSTAVLLELSKHLRDPYYTVFLVFFDGEESISQHITETDGLYGSRDFSQKLMDNGVLQNCMGIINVDMVGDKDFKLTLPANTNLKLYETLKAGAERMNLTDCLGYYNGNIIDDHEAFRSRGIRAINIIDFEYGENNRNWHSFRDNMGNISAESLGKAGKLVHYLAEFYKVY